MSPKAMKTKQQVVSEFRRTEIIRSARKVFARRGFAHAIVDEIATEAEVAKGTIYLYFKSKMEIYQAVLDHDMNAVKRDTLDRVEAAVTLREKIRAFILSRLENAEASKDFFRIMDSESGGLSYTRSQYRDWLREPVERLATFIQKASAANEIRSIDAEKVAWLVVDMTRGTIQRRFLTQAKTPPAADADFLLDLIWSAIAVHP